jgi:hypothetical protein
LAIYSARLCVAAITNAGATVYTAPAGFVIVVRDIVVGQTSSSTPLNCAIYLIISGETFSTVLWCFQNIGNTQAQQWTGRQVMNPTDSIFVQGSESVGTILISGYQLSAP